MRRRPGSGSFLPATPRLPRGTWTGLLCPSGPGGGAALLSGGGSLDSMWWGTPDPGAGESRLTGRPRRTTTAPFSTAWSTRLFRGQTVRGETGIGDHAVSVSYAAIAMAKKIFGDLAGKNVLLLGPERWRNCLEHLKGQAPARSPWPTAPWNGVWRSPGGSMVKRSPWKNCRAAPVADILISSTGAATSSSPGTKSRR